MQATVDSARAYAGTAISQAQHDAQTAILGLKSQLDSTTARVSSTIDSFHIASETENKRADAQMARARKLEVAATLRQTAAAMADQEAQARVEKAQAVSTAALFGAEVTSRVAAALRQTSNAERDSILAASAQSLKETQLAVSAGVAAMQAKAAADTTTAENELARHLAGVQDDVRTKQDTLFSGLSLVRQGALVEEAALRSAAQYTRDSLAAEATAARAKTVADSAALRTSLLSAAESDANAARVLLVQQRDQIHSLITTELQTLASIRLKSEQAAIDATIVAKEASKHAAAEVDRIRATAAASLADAQKVSAAELSALQGTLTEARAKAAASLTTLSKYQAEQVSFIVSFGCLYFFSIIILIFPIRRFRIWPNL
jgi:hypothetical protein